MKDTNIEKWAKIYKDTFVNEAGLSPLDIIKKGEVKKAEYDAEQARVKAEKNRQVIKSIWVMNFKEYSGKKVFAELELTYMDGKKELIEFEVTTMQDDKHHKIVKRNLSKSRKAQGNKAHVTDEDVWLSMIHIAFGDPRIKWYYGKDEATDAKWAFSDAVEDVENENGYGSERFMEEYLDARMSGSSDPWADAEIACGIRDVSDFYERYD